MEGGLVCVRLSVTYLVAISGGMIDLYLVSGPTPDLVTSQIADIIGSPALPPYWSLGFHNCRWGYNNIEEVTRIVNKYIQSHIPFDTQVSSLKINYLSKLS
jgi:alpha-glucosidase (family GH31 glycosyl hydrolase)